MLRRIGLRLNVILFGLIIIGLAGTLIPPSDWETFGAGNGTHSATVAPLVATPLSCGPYAVLVDQPWATSVTWGKGELTRLRVFSPTREVWRLNETAIRGVDCRSLTGDGVPGLIITTFSFGMHCCTMIYVVSLRFEPKLLLQFSAGNGGGEVRDLKGDGSLQLHLDDDSFAYFGGLCFACSPVILPLVACYQDGSFVDCTRQFPGVMRGSIESYRGQLRDTQARIKSEELEAPPGRAAQWDADYWIAGDVLGIYANYILLGQETEGWAEVRSVVRSERVLKWFECNRPTVQRWARHREEEILLGSGPSHAMWETPGCENL